MQKVYLVRSNLQMFQEFSERQFVAGLDLNHQTRHSLQDQIDLAIASI